MKARIVRKKDRTFNAEAFLDSVAVARTIVEYKPKDAIFAQRDLCKDVMCLQKGEVRLSVVSKIGKEAVVAILKPGDFVGEDGLAGQPLRIATAIEAMYRSHKQFKATQLRSSCIPFVCPHLRQIITVFLR
jgi:CRP-like cAMP-binding protein